MDFGRIENFDQVDHLLPNEPEQNLGILAKTKKQRGEVYIGLPVWADQRFIGKIYPDGAKPADFLEHYAKNFNAIELNSSHYHIPPLQQIQNWRSKVPNSFKFFPKFPKSLSHAGVLGSNLDDLKLFHKSLANFGENLGESFLQLPPYFGPDSFNLLKNFIEQLSSDFQYCVEFRHTDWFQNPETFELLSNFLEKKDIGLLITDVSGRRDVLHQRLTRSSCFVRFVGNALHESDFKRLDDWFERASRWIEAGVDIYFFMHQQNEAQGIELVQHFGNLVNEKFGMNLRMPKVLPRAEQTSLF